jgi:hypothetical protein
MEEVAVPAGHKVLVEVNGNSDLIFIDLLGI